MKLFALRLPFYTIVGCANSLSLPGDEQKSRIALRNRLVVELYARAKE